MAKWTPFPHAGDYRFDAASVKKHWARLHGGDAEPCPKDAAALDALFEEPLINILHKKSACFLFFGKVFIERFRLRTGLDQDGGVGADFGILKNHFPSTGAIHHNNRIALSTI